MAEHTEDSCTPQPDSAVICEVCDMVYRRQALTPQEKALCVRCGAELYRDNRRIYRLLLPLVMAALALFLIANIAPVIEMDFNGVRTMANVWTAIVAMNHDGMLAVSVAVFCTIVLFPACEILVLCYVLISLATGRRAPFFSTALRLMHRARRWSMLEVFLIGVAVAAVKLGTMAEVRPMPGLGAYGALVLLLTYLQTFDIRYLWTISDQRAL